MARLYADEDFDYPVVEELGRLGHDVLTVQEAGQANQKIPDEEVLKFARSLGRAVLTHNRRHFSRLHMADPTHSGIITCTRDKDAAALAARIHQALKDRTALDDQLIRITRPPVP
jgi:hypothetical protein